MFKTLYYHLRIFHNQTALNGRYTKEKLESLSQFLKFHPFQRSFRFHLTIITLLPSFIILLNTIPYDDISNGWKSKNVYIFLYLWVGLWIASFGEMLKLEQIYPFLQYSTIGKIILTLIPSLITIVLVLVIVIITDCFPLPFFFFITGAICLPVFATLLLFTIPKELRVQVSLILMYNLYLVFYQRAETISIFLSGASLPLMHYLVERILYICHEKCTHYQSKNHTFLISNSLFISQTTNTLYTAMCIQVSKSTKAVFVLCVLEIIDAYYDTKVMYHEIRLLLTMAKAAGKVMIKENYEYLCSIIETYNEIRPTGNTCRSIQRHSSEIVPIESTDLIEPYNTKLHPIQVGVNPSSISPRKSPLVRMLNSNKVLNACQNIKRKWSSFLVPVDNPRSTTSSYLQQQLRILHVTEHIAVQRYIKLILPFFFHIINEMRAYTAVAERDLQLLEFRHNTKRAMQIRINSSIFVTTQLILTLLLWRIGTKYVHYCVFHQLSNKLSYNRLLVYYLFSLCILISETFTQPHFGNDFTFKEICLKHKP